MLKIEFINSPDEEIISVFERHQRPVTVGIASSNHIVLQDPSIGDEVLSLSTDENGVWVENSNNKNFYLSNSKKTFGKKLHQTGDLIQFGKSVFKIIDYRHAGSLAPMDEFKKLKKNRLSRDPEISDQLEHLKNEVKKVTFKSLRHD